MENKLRHIISTIITEELNEMARIPTMLIIGDATKLEHAKRLYDDETFWVRKMIDAVEAAGETGISRMGYEIEGGEYIDGLTDIADKSQLLVNPKIKDLINIGLFAESGSIIPKKVKSTEVGQRGRKVGNKTLVAKEVNSKLEADNEYQANEAELETLGAEFIEKLRMRVKGTLKRGRKANPAKSTDGMVAVRNAMNSEEELEDMNDESFDPLVYDDDEDENFPLNEWELSMQDYFDRATSDNKKDKELITIANEMFPEFEGKLEDFVPLTKEQRNKVYKEYSAKNNKPMLNKQLKPMKKPLNEQFKRMQKLAGLNENSFNPNTSRVEKIKEKIQQEYPEIIEKGTVEKGTEEWLFLLELSLKTFGIYVKDPYDILDILKVDLDKMDNGKFDDLAQDIDDLGNSYVTDLETALEELGVEAY